MGVFDPSVFDPNVFDTEDEEPSAPLNSGTRSVMPGGAGFQFSGRLRRPRLGPKLKPKTFPTVLSRAIPKVDLKPLGRLATEDERREERWRAWQQSPDAAGKGSASMMEFMVWEFLVYKKRQIEGEDFIYQYPLLGGRTQFGGFVADFYFPLRQEVWNPAGLQFHWVDAQHRARDTLAKKILAGRGVKLIYLYEDDMLQRPDYVLNLAWEQSSEVPGRQQQ